MTRFPLVVALLATLACSSAHAAEAKKIQDNSFLLEEAYNQEDGVIQHIQSYQYMKDHSWAYSFTQEWPVPNQTHQLSYTIPALKLVDGETQRGVGDVLLNYRYQAVLKGPIALSPRASLVLPTGDHKKGLGGGAAGVQVNLPMSVELSDSIVTHWNAGGTFIPKARSAVDGTKADTTSLSYGASLIWLARENFNLMLEAVAASAESVGAQNQVERGNSLFLNPGFRYAYNHKSGLQVVPGVSFPLGIGPSKGKYGALFYLSFEHPLF